jgi:phosphonate transport system substrate-binding protein
MIKILLSILFATSLISCISKNEIGTKDNPIKISLVPGQDAKVLEENGHILEEFLEKKIGKEFSITIPHQFVAVVEALGSKRADMAIMNTFGYILASEKYGARVRLIGTNRGLDHYWGQIIARKDGPKSIEEIQGKKFAFVDPASTSGYLLAAKLMKEKGIKPRETVFAGRHDSVVTMVYQGQVDAGSTYFTPDENGVPQDARSLLKTQFPDIFEKVVILAKTGPIPSDPIVFRKDFPPELEDAIIAALKEFVQDPKGQATAKALYHLTGFRDASEADYAPVRQMLLELGKSAQDFIK